ncbi:hypothetical protein WS87_08585 [Burkholderia sp. MSMB0856]|uniref:DUF4054 domain-containing protein n=1 Tax=Burkholderia sp. MSMB0856 TaxID=1637869 RepID=UPI000753F5CC|nr:DUF4054 domain-containing protein [Burkholderia sp. MSMB0856]AOJ86724.1 hypothetical protein WS87_08585 [Burkholderia sp. MSMB0856]KVH38065.1 hypothetical protein WS87_00195 [Burkholderia sp. MSMB0856]
MSARSSRGAPITVADVRARFAALSKPFDDDIVLLAIGDVLPFLDRERWGGFYQRTACGLVMHFLVMARAAERTGGKPVLTATSKKAGEVQASYAVPTALTGDDAWLAATTWGQEYLKLRRIVGAGGLVV